MTVNSVISSREVLAEFREIFNLVDRDGGGTISKDEWVQLFEIVGIEATKEDIDKMVQQVDVDNSGEIDFDEFATLMTRRVNPNYTCQQVKHGFELIQIASGSDRGKVHIKELIHYLTSYGSEKLSEERANELVMQMEVDHNGYVNYEEYVDMMMNW